MGHSIWTRFVKVVKVSTVVLPTMILFQNCGAGFEVSKEMNLSSSAGALDSIAPSVAILSPTDGNYLKSQTNIMGACEDGLPILWYIDDAQTAETAICDQGGFVIPVLVPLTDGDHMLYVSQTDGAGNKGDRQINFKVDNTAPVQQITAPAGNSMLISTSSVDISGSCESGLEVSISGTALSAPLKAACANSAFVAQGVLASTAGAKTLVIEQTDLADNKGSASINLTLELPLNAPMVKIMNPAANFATNSRNITVSGSCESGLMVKFSGAGLSVNVGQVIEAPCNNSAFSQAIQLTTGDSLKNIIVAQTNSQNKTGQDSRSFNLDTAAPAVTIASPAAGTKAVTGVSLAGNCETGLMVNIAGTGIDTPKNVACTANAYQTMINFSSGNGVKNIVVSQTDAATNKGTVMRDFEKIDPPPLDGKLLYANHCASCHGPVDMSTKVNRTATQISLAIDNIPSMQNIVLSTAEVAAIAQALQVTTTPSPTIPTVPLGTVRVATVPDNMYKADAFGVVPMRRLTQDELRYTLLDVLKVDPGALIDKVPTDIIEEKISPFDNNSDNQSTSLSIVESYETFATDYSKMFVGKNATIDSLAGCTPTSAGDTACFNKFATNVGRFLFRRPVTSTELTRYAVLLDHSKAANDYYVAPQLLIQMFVQHPEFLYRAEVGTAISGSTLRSLTDYEIASRMSYLIWGSAPDASLLNAAAAGTLKNATERMTQAQRMLGDARARRQWQRYHEYWLGYKDQQVPAALAADMKAESNALVDYIAFMSTSDWMGIFTYDQTYVSRGLASHYGLTPPSTASGWVKRDGGILTHGQFLAQGAKFGDTSPTLRGYRIAKRVLCYDLGPVPVGVDPDKPPTGTSATSCKPERYNMRTLSTCKNCHGITDNIGFGLENFTASGQFRTAETGLPQCTITGEGALGVDLFKGPAELGQKLASNPVAIQCASRQLLRFALGRATDAGDQNTVEAMHAQYLKGSKLTDMVQALVATPAFIHKK